MLPKATSKTVKPVLAVKKQVGNAKNTSKTTQSLVATKIIKKAPLVKKMALAVVKNTTANETKKAATPKVAAKVAEVSPEKSSELMQM
jgi:hypothetical protein